jgi:hypothetical protein
MAKRSENGKEDHKIKRLLRHRVTGEYFKRDGWTKNFGEATHFSTVVEVAEVCARNGLRDVELALCADASGAELFCTLIR